MSTRASLIVYGSGYGMKRISEMLSRFTILNDICAFKVQVLCLPAGLGFGNNIELVQIDYNGVFTDPRSTHYACTSGVRLDTTSPNQCSPYIVDCVIRSIHKMTRAYLFTSKLLKVKWYAAMKFAIYVTKTGSRIHRTSLLFRLTARSRATCRGFALSDACVTFRSI